MTSYPAFYNAYAGIHSSTASSVAHRHTRTSMKNLMMEEMIITTNNKASAYEGTNRDGRHRWKNIDYMHKCPNEDMPIGGASSYV